MSYNVNYDLKLIREIAGLTQEQMAKELGVEPITIVRIENGDSYSSNKLISKIYDLAFKYNIDMSYIKEMFYLEELSKDHYLLFHGSKDGIEGNISLDKCSKSNDFDQAFCCGESVYQTVSFVYHYSNSSYYIIDFDPLGLKYIKYNVDLDWMLTIAYFRGLLSEYENHPKIQELLKGLDGIDYIIAPIADNRMYTIIERFTNTLITDEQCIHSLAATNLGYQYVFITKKAIDNLQILEHCFISNKEREMYESKRKDEINNSINKVKAATIKYKNQGKYIEEILK